MAAPKRIVAIADNHSGHRAGLTPPQFWFHNYVEGTPSFSKRHPVANATANRRKRITHIRKKFANMQRQQWNRYAAMPRAMGEIYALIHCGDSIDGRGERSGGVELITGNRSVLAMTLPALQGMGSRFGARKCSGTVDWGIVWFDVQDGKLINWGDMIPDVPQHRATAWRI